MAETYDYDVIRSRDVIGKVTIQFSRDDFLIYVLNWVKLSNLKSIKKLL